MFEDELLAVLPRLRRFARALTRDAGDADDLVQTAVEKGLRARAAWRPDSRMDSWMYRIVRNSWIDTSRSRTRAAQTFVAPEAGDGIAGEGAAEIETQVALGEVGAAMATLPDDQREAVALVLVEGLTYREAAAVLGIPHGTLTSRLIRGRNALAAMLGEAA